MRTKLVLDGIGAALVLVVTAVPVGPITHFRPSSTRTSRSS